MKIKEPKFFTRAKRKFKRITKLLSHLLLNKRLESFTLSVKFHRNGLNEPITSSLQGKRSADGNWTQFSSINKKTGALQSREILKEKLACIEERVRAYIMESALGQEWEKQESLLKEEMNSGLTVDDLEYRHETPVLARIGYGYEAHFYAPRLATAYAIEAAEAFLKNDLDHASHCVDRGLHWSNSSMFLPDPKDRFIKRASEGGKSKALVYEPVKDKVAELLMKLVPEEGWASTSIAIKAVADELIDCHSNFVEERKLKPENLPRTIWEWIQVDPKRFPHPIKSDT